MNSLLKRAIDRLGGAAKSVTAAGRSPPQSADVVIVDDSTALQAMLGQLIHRAGLSRSVAASLEEVQALDLGASGSLLLLDLALERSDAFDVLRHLSEVGFAGPIVPMSGQETAVLDYVGSFGRQLGLTMLPALRKPFRADALKAILATHVGAGKGPIQLDFDDVLARDQVEVWYQPRVELGSFRITGFEALVRVRHPTEGLLLPGRFMSQLGDADMLNLTTHVLRRTIATWQGLARAGFVLKASMNVRARELLSPALIDVLKDSRPDDARWSGLLMELSEPKLVDEVEAVREAVVRLQLHKVQLALDDFGTVASGSVKCPELKLSEVGVDRRFVNGCARDPDRLAICKAAVLFAGRTRMRVVAEGVELAEDLKAVRALGFHWAQGNLFSAAVPYGTLERLLQRREPLWAGTLSVGKAA